MPDESETLRHYKQLLYLCEQELDAGRDVVASAVQCVTNMERAYRAVYQRFESHRKASEAVEAENIMLRARLATRGH